ncbi:molybdopterin-dependent oxidoreductase [Allorhizobium sp. BGMRC 0089]|uniref:molybdopterin-dependent oxidoreductase n=1 Tax=Allorhizobium sonneratiae TaxID=2934936 RepID=UPI00203410A7|nr:molybdopterin-dependent oxidoreductase [Allorhizobium sonneratiae]MCM2291518.1 molybdopterin-dependent oxidoreductase [Allorhizobium sonneratiae]
MGPLRLACLFLLSVLAFAGPALALDEPQGPVILTVHGPMTHPNRGKDAVFDRQMLERLPGRTVSLVTPWTKGKPRFSGPYLRAVLEAAGAAPTARITIHALNDYSATLPPEDFVGINTILATRQDGEPMSVREKGPLMVIYPFDEDSKLYSETYFSRSVWQISDIEVLP